MYNDEWELFYCEALDENENEFESFVDLLSVNVSNKRFILDVHCNDLCTDGYREDGSEVVSWGISRELLYILLEGLKQKQ